MRVIPQGRRAGLFVGLGKNRLWGLKTLRQNGQYAVQSSLSIPGGELLAKRQGNIESLFINVRDPYLVMLVRESYDSGATTLKLYTGGVTGEYFLPDLVPEGDLGSFGPSTSSWVYAGDRVALQAYRDSSSIISQVNLTSGPYDLDFGPTIVWATIGVSYQHFRFNGYPDAYRVICNALGQPLVQYEPFGETELGAICALASARVVIDAVNGRTYDVLFRINNPAEFDVFDIIWPPASLNGNRPDLALISSFVTAYAPGSVIFLQSYVADWQNPPSHPVPEPQVVRLTDFGSTSAFTDLTDIDAGLAGTQVNFGTDFVYAGDGDIVFLLNQDSVNYKLYHSDDYGATWSVDLWPAPAGEALSTFGFDMHAAYSLFPGHVEFITIDATPEQWRYQSFDGGATWNRTAIPSSGFRAISRTGAQVMKLTASGELGKYLLSGVDENDKPAVYVFDGNETVDYTNKLVVTGNADYTTGMSGYTYPPWVCWYGSREFPPPLLRGHPGELEN